LKELIEATEGEIDFGTNAEKSTGKILKNTKYLENLPKVIPASILFDKERMARLYSEYEIECSIEREIEKIKNKLWEIARNGGNWHEIRTEILKMGGYFLRYNITTELLDYVKNVLQVHV
jgi:hypothetical protein